MILKFALRFMVTTTLLFGAVACAPGSELAEDENKLGDNQDVTTEVGKTFDLSRLESDQNDGPNKVFRPGEYFLRLETKTSIVGQSICGDFIGNADWAKDGVVSFKNIKYISSDNFATRACTNEPIDLKGQKFFFGFESGVLRLQPTSRYWLATFTEDQD